MVRFIIFCFSLCISHIVWCGRTLFKQNSRLVNPYLKADDPERDAAGALLALSWWGQVGEQKVKRIRILFRDTQGTRRHAGPLGSRGWREYTPVKK